MAASVFLPLLALPYTYYLIENKPINIIENDAVIYDKDKISTEKYFNKINSKSKIKS